MSTPIVTATPDTLTLPPGGSAQVTVAVDPASPYGSGSVTIPVEVPPPYDGTIQGNFGGLVPAGEHWHVTGDVNQIGDCFVEGLLTGVDTFHWQGNGFSVFFQNGGRSDLHGKIKGRWGEWGTGSLRAANTTGWVNGDRLGITPTAYGKYVPLEGLWTGDWATLIRPANSPDVLLVDGSIGKPEVVNLSQSIVFENLARGFHFHNSAGVQSLSDVKFLNCGTTGVLGNYPCHFHLLGDNSRGSILERVVVEGGKNHAFVPHGSHGITFVNCVAWNTINDAFWWDPPPATGDITVNNSHDTLWQHCLAAGVLQTPGSTKHRMTAFYIGAGSGNRCLDSVATCVRGEGGDISGFHWSETFVWEFVGNRAHNVKKNAITTWTNSQNRHIIDGFFGYHFGQNGIDHGAYKTQFVYRNVSLTVTNPIGSGSGITRAVTQHSNSMDQGLLFENIVTDDRLVITHHGLPGTVWSTHRNCRYTSVLYIESGGSGAVHPSQIRYEDCGLDPADFTLNGIVPTSEIEIIEAGVLTHRWANGAWS